MTAELLTTEDYTKILQERFKTNEIQFISASYSPLSENIEGFVGDHFILQITYQNSKQEKKIDNVFVKTKPTKTEIQIKMVEEMNVYQKEIFLYDYLFKEYEKNGYDTSFAPKSYFCKPFETIVLENLKIRDFILAPRTKFYDLDHCKVSLKALAQYHGNALSYEEKKTKELGKRFRVTDFKPEVFNEIFYTLGGNDFGEKFCSASFKTYAALSEIMPESKMWKRSFQERILSMNLPKIFNKPLPFRKTCCHGDLWSNNMLFKYENDVPIHCCLVDYQLLRYHHPGFDVMLILYSNTSRDFRKQYLNELLDYYYDVLNGIVLKNGFHLYDILPKDDFLKSIDELKPVALLQGTSTRLMTHFPKEDLNNAVNAGGEELEKMMFSDTRVNLVIDGCKRNNEFRKIMFDDVYDLDETI